MLEFLMNQSQPMYPAILLVYDILDADDVVENDVFYFNPFSNDEEMPSLWLKANNIQVAWYSDNPARGASCNVEPNLENALHVLDTVRSYADTRTKAS